MKLSFWPAVAALFAGVANADWQLIPDDGCFLHEGEAGVSIHASRGIRGAPERWALRWVLDPSWGVERPRHGYRQVIPLQFSDGLHLNARVRWNGQDQATLLTPDLDQAFRSSQWVSIGDRQISLEGAVDAWRRLLSCMGEAGTPSSSASVSDSGWLLVDGHIGAGWAQKQIHRLVAAMPLQGVLLNSDGGRVAEALQLAQWIRQNKLATAVQEGCASACVLAFAGGVDRYLGPKARIGLHQFSAVEGGSFSGGQQVTAETADFFDAMGIDNDLALLAAKTASSEIRWLTHDEAMRYKLATAKLANARGMP